MTTFIIVSNGINNRLTDVFALIVNCVCTVPIYIKQELRVTKLLLYKTRFMCSCSYIKQELCEAGSI